MIDWGYKAQRLAYRAAKALGLAQPQTRRPPATVGKPTLKAQVIHFINKPMPGGLPKHARARAARHRGRRDRADHPRSRQKVNDDSDAVFYFPGCGSERLFSQVGLATQAMLYHVGAQMRAAAGLPVLRLSADGGRRPRQGPGDHHRQPRAVPPRGQHAQLSRHQDRDRVVRHLHGPAAEVRIREDLPRLPAARHPRIPAGEGRQARRRRRACATCTTTPATRR